MHITLNKYTENKDVLSQVYNANACLFIDRVYLTVETDYKGNLESLIKDIQNLDLVVYTKKLKNKEVSK